MPAFDGTGPEGLGKGTGLRQGICDARVGRQVVVWPRGGGRYWGWGPGRARWVSVEPASVEGPHVSFSPDEIEAMQLVDIDGKDAKDAAKDMHVPEDIFQSYLETAHTKAALALFTDTGYAL